LIARLLERAEASTASAMEELDATDSFGVLLARTAENAAAPSHIGTEALDLALTAATPLEVVSTYRTTTLRLSPARSITQLQVTTSTELSVSGMCSM
jgi:uncharacterized protein (DUF58 family)